MRCGYCSWLGGSRAVLFKKTLRASPTLARMPYRWASAHQKGSAASMLATSPVFRGFSINFSPDGHGLGGFFMPFCTAWCMVGRAGSHTVRQIHTLISRSSRMCPACRVLTILTFTGVHDLSRYVERQGQQCKRALGDAADITPPGILPRFYPQYFSTLWRTYTTVIRESGSHTHHAHCVLERAR